MDPIHTSTLYGWNENLWSWIKSEILKFYGKINRERFTYETIVSYSLRKTSTCRILNKIYLLPKFQRCFLLILYARNEHVWDDMSSHTKMQKDQWNEGSIPSIINFLKMWNFIKIQRRYIFYTTNFH